MSGKKQRLLYGPNDQLRLYPSAEKADVYRSEWRKDYGRLIHCPSFRRLQGKTQLFPNHESDFYRNRLTHSLEVAQIAKCIALKINHEHFKGKDGIDLDMIEVAALAHDLGHPPFGHNGESALDELMRDEGGFEGNAQTLRILTRLEKKVLVPPNEKGVPKFYKEEDRRAGLNLTSRTLAAVLKYDSKIPERNKDRKVQNKVAKGYYETERPLVEQIKKNVLQDYKLKPDEKFKTVECQIMDIADDIAYSTYDIEDSFKAEFLSPLSLLSAGDDFYSEIAKEISEKLEDEYPNATKEEKSFKSEEMIALIAKLFQPIFEPNLPATAKFFRIASRIDRASEEAATIGYLRTDLTSTLVALFMDGIKFEKNEKLPALSQVKLDIRTFKAIETLKKFAYKSLILSPRLKMSEYRGKEIVTRIFKTLQEDGNYMLMPKDYKDLYGTDFATSEKLRNRTICDFIAGMTDSYAMEFYDRLFGTKLGTIHKPF